MRLSRQQARDILVDAVKIPSPSGHEQTLANLLADKMNALGFSSHVDAAGNVIGEIGAREGPTTVLLGHIDTIPTLLPVIDSDDRLMGRGTVDAKGPLCCFICSAAALASSPLRIVVIGAVEEETTSRGARALAGRYNPVAVFIGEPSGATAVVIGYKGRIGGTYSRFCRTGHIAGPQDNAAVDVTRFWTRIEDYCRNWLPSEKIFVRPEPTISRISGDGTTAELHFDVRVPEDFDVDAFLNCVTRHSGEGVLRIEEMTRAVKFSRSSLPARALTASLRAAGHVPRIKVKTGTCDMNVVREFWRCPMVAYGPGDSKLDHSSEEHLPYAEYFTAIETLTDALSRLSLELAADFAGQRKFRSMERM